MNERDLFIAALQQENPAERRRLLDEACRADEALCRRVEALLEVHERAGAFLGAPAAPPVPTAAGKICETPGTLIGSYKLLEQIGEGGFGIVFMAEQQHPVRRKVALKVLKPGMDTRQVVARFEAERQALALMDHPHIAHIFDGGETASGRPYFVMELVRGIPVTEFCDQNHMGVRERLELYVTVCQAVQHAHQRGIIHRDLKPSNVLVTLHDDRPVVKVIDFGIAKATGQQLTEKTLFTNFAQMIGTPLYMSPEQAKLSGLDLDTRSDIYSLGVLLYELLTGTTPFDKERLRTAAYDEILRIIREEEPAKPSMRLSTLGQAADGVSANRHSDPKRLVQLCRGELDWIVMKALEKDRNRRYESASAFAADVQRYLDDEPVQACPPTLVQRAAKWSRRHRSVVWAAVLLLVVAMIGSAVSTFLILRQRDVAEQQRDFAEANRRRAEQILDTAYRSLDKMYLAWAEKRLPQAKEITPEDRELLEGALAFYAEFANQNSSKPKGRRMTAEAYQRVANIHSQLGQDAQAKQNYRHALQVLRRLTAEFPNDAEYRCSLARCLSEMAFMSAAAAYGAMVDYQPLYFDTMAENEEAFGKAVELQERLVAEDPTRADYQWDLAVSYKRLGNHLSSCFSRHDEAEKLLRSAYTVCIRLAEEHPTVLTYRQELCDLLGHLGGILMDTGRLPEAERIFRESLDRRKKLVADFPGQTYPRYCLGWGYQDLATLQARTHRLEDAAENYRQAAEIRAKLAADFPGVRMYQVNLAVNYGALALVWHQMDRFEEAEQAYEKALAVREVLARDYPAILDYAWARSGTQTQLGELILERGRPEAALALHGQAIAAMKKLLAGQPQHMRARRVLLQALGGRANALITLGRLKELEQTYKDLEQHYEQAIKLDSSDHNDWFCLAPLLLQRGDIDGYRRVCQEMLTRFSQTGDPWIADVTAKTCLLRPDAISDLASVRKLADRATTGTKQNMDYRWFLLTRGMADYRAGEFASAIARLTEDLSLADEKRYGGGRKRDPALDGMVYVFLAMAHHRLGHADQARQALDQATQLMSLMIPKTGEHTTCRTDWADWLRLQVVYREAEQLVRS